MTYLASMSNQTQQDLWIVRESGKRGYKPTHDHLKCQWVAATTRCNSKGSYGNERTIHTYSGSSINHGTNISTYTDVSASISYLFSMVSILYYVLRKSHVGGSGFVKNVHPRTSLAVGTKDYLLFFLTQAGH